MIGPIELKTFDKEASPLEKLLFFIERNGQEFLLRYEFHAKQAITWPKLEMSGRTYKLWQTTCFEFFLTAPERNEYLEFNFSPSSQWDVYHFTQYRQPQEKRVDGIHVNVFDIHENGLCAKFKIPWSDSNYLASATAVIQSEEKLHYFAIKHAELKPDFHDRSTFLLKL